MKRKHNIKFLLLSIAIPLAAGGSSYLLTGQNFLLYTTLKQPPFSPPASVFPIAWTILYILMGISTYFAIHNVAYPNTIHHPDSVDTMKKGLLFYALQLAFNILWSPVFFRFKFYFPALIILAILWYFVYQTYSTYKKISSVAGWLFLPYVIWCTYAFYLNFGIVILN